MPQDPMRHLLLADDAVMQAEVARAEARLGTARACLFDTITEIYRQLCRHRQKQHPFSADYGREDDVVDPATQPGKFLTVLKQAGLFARTIVAPGAGHLWSADPVEEPGSFGAYVGTKLVRFLDGALPPLNQEH
jgi:hypothetical protein